MFNKMSNIPTINMVMTGQNIRNLRIDTGLSVKDLQKIFGFATPHISLEILSFFNSKFFVLSDMIQLSH